MDSWDIIDDLSFWVEGHNYITKKEEKAAEHG